MLKDYEQTFQLCARVANPLLNATPKEMILTVNNRYSNFNDYYEATRSNAQSFSKLFFCWKKKENRKLMSENIQTAINAFELDKSDENKNALILILKNTIETIDKENNYWESGMKKSCQEQINKLDDNIYTAHITRNII